ncbi:MAG: LysE family transporter [Saprospiraceae bacterium]
MVQFVIEGLLLGLTLTILLGPIFVALTQTGIQYGIKAGISVGSGIWISDILVILASYFFITQIDFWSHDPGFQFWTGMVGGMVLMIFGLGAIFNKHTSDVDTRAFTAKSYLGFMSKGFAVNFINPFTFAFWISVMSTYVMVKKATVTQVVILFSTIMLTIMITDSLKVVLAKMIRHRMRHHHIVLFSRIAGIMLIIFGVILMVRTNVI